MTTDPQQTPPTNTPKKQNKTKELLGEALVHLRDGGRGNAKQWLCVVQAALQREGHDTSVLDLVALGHVLRPLGQEGLEEVLEPQRVA